MQETDRSKKKETGTKLKKKSNGKGKTNAVDKKLKQKKEELPATIVRWIQLLKALKLKQLKNHIHNELSTYEMNKSINEKLIFFLNEELQENEISHKIDELKNSKLELLFGLHKENMSNLQKKFEKDITKLFQDYEKDEIILQNNKNHLINEINKIYKNIEENKQKRKKEIKREEENVIEEIYENYIAEKYIINYNVEKFKEDTENFNNVLTENEKILNKENEKYNAIQMEYEKNKKKLHSKKKEVYDLQSKIDSWKFKLENEVNIYDGQIEKLKREKELLLNHIRAIKLILQKLKHNDKQRLIDISVNLSNCIEKLEENTALANKLIGFNNLCRKYETDREKYFLTVEEINDKKEVFSKEEKEYMDSLKTKSDKHFHVFENFFKRQNKVVLDLMILKKHLQKLKKKNKEYKIQISELKNKYDVDEKVKINAKDFVVNAL